MLYDQHLLGTKRKIQARIFARDSDRLGLNKEQLDQMQDLDSVRIEQTPSWEHGAHVISTVPTVPYTFEFSDGSKLQVQNPAALPSNPKNKITCWEPTVLATIIIPSEYVGPVITLCSDHRGEQLEYTFIDSLRVFLKYRLPLREIVVDFYNGLRSITSGYASFDYEEAESLSLTLSLPLPP
ncbi:hypothetical protein POM88_006547 [Heracleum sosnowskyi]|uniref:Elongation factor EFG domain-containing protein n=2 Tax=Heracleum sosnowskyi TaxID=360622 RepID=A0AAD8J2Y2_9APIA|nr:hypothetical protein POM88_006547 [Heracleum sosnowskyi]